MSASRRLAPSKRSSARANSSRAALAASSAARASRSASAERIFGLGQTVGAGAPVGFRLGDFADQGVALLGKDLRRVLQLRAVALGLGDALVERGDLVVRAVAAPDPAGAVGGERG